MAILFRPESPQNRIFLKTDHIAGNGRAGGYILCQDGIVHEVKWNRIAPFGPKCIQEMGRVIHHPATESVSLETIATCMPFSMAASP